MADPSSPLATALEDVGDRWSLLLVESLLEGPRRFGELLERVDGIAPNILTDRLRRLERDGILVPRAYQERPPRFEYRLTAEGRDLASALRLLADWGTRRHDPTDTGGSSGPMPAHHDRCGTTLETRWFCPTCAVVVDEPSDPEVRRV
ncbi:MAG: helix-turn-helix domain-containing protein [Chloroflexota bacterium]